MPCDQIVDVASNVALERTHHVGVIRFSKRLKQKVNMLRQNRVTKELTLVDRLAKPQIKNKKIREDGYAEIWISVVGD